MSELSPLRLISDRQDRLDSRLEKIEEDTAEIPVLRKEVGLLREAVDRNTTALYQAAAAILVAVGGGVVTALILKGVIG